MIVIIDYGLGNLASVKNAFDKLGIPVEISADPDVLKTAEALILPGVGAAGQGMENLKKKGLDKVIIEELTKGKPFLGICLGMQLLFENSEEGKTNCLGIFKGTVKKYKKEKKIPQIGWNSVKTTGNKLFKDIPNNSYFYFVNSFYCQPKDSLIIVGKSEYGEKFVSAVIKNKIVGIQFHPEKSGEVGFQLLKNFVNEFCKESLC